MSKTVPAIERVGITTSGNIADDALLGNPPYQCALKFERILELAAEHEYGGAAGGVTPREHYFRSGDLATFAMAVLAEAQQLAVPQFDLDGALSTLQQVSEASFQAQAILTAIEDRADDEPTPFGNHIYNLARIGVDIVSRDNEELTNLICSIRDHLQAQSSEGGAQ